MAKNRLYYGDNLDVLRRYVDDESVDLVYLKSCDADRIEREAESLQNAQLRW